MLKLNSEKWKQKYVKFKKNIESFQQKQKTNLKNIKDKIILFYKYYIWNKLIKIKT